MIKQIIVGAALLLTVATVQTASLYAMNNSNNGNNGNSSNNGNNGNTNNNGNSGNTSNNGNANNNGNNGNTNNNGNTGNNSDNGNTEDNGQKGNEGNNPSTDNGRKVFVCKYVGTPHVDERLQTGNNPISTSVNSIQNNQWDGTTIPAWFSDAHDRSYVLKEDTRTGGGQQGEPSVSECPAPVGPEEPETPGTPGTPGEPGKGDFHPTPVVTDETPAAQPVVTSDVEALPYTAGDHSLAYTLIAAGLATVVIGLGVSLKSLYRHSA